MWTKPPLITPQRTTVAEKSHPARVLMFFSALLFLVWPVARSQPLPPTQPDPNGSAITIPACTKPALQGAQPNHSPTGTRLLSSVVIIQSGTMLGSGVIISPAGYILTAAHLLPNTDQAAVYLSSGAVENGRIVYRNPTQDTLILKITAETPDCLSLRKHRLPAGSPIYSIAFSPEKGGRFILSKGRVFGYLQGGTKSPTYIKTSLDLMPGSSGGPMLDEQGQVAGIISWKITGPRKTSASFGTVPVSLPVGVQVSLK